MIVTLQKKFLSWWQLGILGLLIFGSLCRVSPDIWPDTYAYLRFDSVRPPLYPIFLWLFHVFGQYQLIIAMWVQGILNFLVLVYANHWLYDRLAIPKFIIFILLSSTVILVFLHFTLLQSILSEALSFPIFIMTFLLLVDSFRVADIKKIIYLSILSNLLILTREQFYYFYLLLGVLIAWYFWKQVPTKKILGCLAVIGLSVTIFSLLNQSYHYLLHKRFTGSSAVGLVIIPQAFYLASPDAAYYFKNINTKLFFERTIKKLEEMRLTSQTPPIPLRSPLTLDVASVYYDIAYLSILKTVKSNLPLAMTSYESSAFLSEVAKVLYLHTIKKNLLFYAWRVASFMGGIWLFCGFLMVLFSAIFRILIDRAWQPTVNQIFIILSFLTILANAVFIALFAHNEFRYFYYAYFLYFCLAGQLAKEFF